MRLPTADPYLADHGDPGWSARRYALELDYDLVNNTLRGRAEIRGFTEAPLDRIVLDLALPARKVALDGRAPRFRARGHRLVVEPRTPLRAGREFTLVITYGGTPRPIIDPHHGDAGWEELTDGVIVAGQPHGAPTWFPCNDRPDDKAPYELTITVPTGYVAVANGVLRQRKQGGSRVTFHYDQPEPMASYLATVQIGRYDVRELGAVAGVPVRAAVPADAGDGFEAAFGRSVEMVEVFTDLFGPYPFGAYTAVVTDDDLEIPLESQGLATFGRNFCTGDWDSVRLVAHELAHQWFGNAVTLRRWRDIWLHEGFACYAEWLWSERSGGESAAHHAAHHHARLADLDQDLVLADPGPELMFDDRVYKRGALTLHALRTRLGDDPFFDLLRSWVAEHDGGSVTSEDFEVHAAARSGEDLASFFRAWLHEPALPALP